MINCSRRKNDSKRTESLHPGYTRAARIIDELENCGIVGPSKGAEPCDILIDLDSGAADGAVQGL